MKRFFVLLPLSAFAPAAAAAAMRPFAVGGGEGGGGSETGLVGWLLGLQSAFTHAITADVKAMHDDPHALLGLLGLGLLYGVAHAAGPGHGKGIIASYVTAGDRALRRGIVLAFLAALLQGAVAVAIVGIMAAILNLTANAMNLAADWLSIASALAVAAIGAVLVVRKGRALVAALGAWRRRRAAVAAGALYAGAPWRGPQGAAGTAPFRAADPTGAAAIDLECGHVHTLDAAALGDSFTWRGALGAIAAAGARPCSGALLVLVFTLAQGVFWAGVATTFAMALGVAVTTSAIAAGAALFKSAALRAAAGEDSRLALVARSVEFAAAAAVLFFGLALAFGATQGA